MSDKDNIIKLLKKSNSICIITHINPDGDCIGSSLALGLGLEKVGKEVAIVDDHEVPQTYRFLPGSSKIIKPQDANKDYDLVISLDAADLQRLEQSAELLKKGKYTINIDHHSTNHGFAEVNWVDPKKAATGEMVYELLLAMNIDITKDMAICVYTAISTDTGSFMFSNTTVHTLEIAAKMVDIGADPGFIGENVFDTKDLAALKLLGKALTDLQISQCKKISWMVIDETTMNEFNVDRSDLEGFVNYAKMIKDISVAILFRQEGDDIKLSFRSRGNANVAEIAGQYGGGGHKKAAGCSIKGKLDDVTDRVIAEVTKYLHNHK